MGGSLAFAAQKRTEPPAHPHDRTAGVRPPMPWRTVAPLAVVCLALGILFGAAEVTTVAFADEQGQQGLGRRPARAVGARQPAVRGGHRRDLVEVAARTSGSAGAPSAWRARWLPLYFVDSVPLMGLLLLVGGVAIAPTMIGRAVPDRAHGARRRG